MKAIAERRGITQSIAVTSGASQCELEATGETRSGVVVSVSLKLTEQEVNDLRDELDHHAAKLRAARQPFVESWVKVNRHDYIGLGIPDFDAALQEFE